MILLFWLASRVLLFLSPAHAENRAGSRDFPSFLEHAVRAGWHGPVQKSVADALGLERNGTPGSLLERDPSTTTDGLDHRFWVVLAGTASAEPLFVCVVSESQSEAASDTYYMKVSTAGALERSVFVHRRRDARGRTLWNTGMAEETEIDSDDIRRRFRHELDFWLKGAYRKPRRRP